MCYLQCNIVAENEWLTNPYCYDTMVECDTITSVCFVEIDFIDWKLFVHRHNTLIESSCLMAHYLHRSNSVESSFSQDQSYIQFSIDESLFISQFRSVFSFSVRFYCREVNGIHWYNNDGIIVKYETFLLKLDWIAANDFLGRCYTIKTFHLFVYTNHSNRVWIFFLTWKTILEVPLDSMRFSTP